MKKTLFSCLLIAAFCNVVSAGILFDFENNTALIDALDDQNSPVSFTNSGLGATFTASDGTMNITESGFGLNASTSDDDETDAFDVGEWLDITFHSDVTLTNINTSSWNATNDDEATIYVNGVSNGVITATGSHDFNIGIPNGQVLRIESTAGVVGNGWQLDNLLVELDEPLGTIAPVLDAIGNKAVVVSNELKFSVSASDANGDNIALSATNLPGNAVFNAVTNAAAVTQTFTWTEAAPTGTYPVTFFADDGTTNVSETITITVSEESVLPESVTFDFRNDAPLYGALDDQTGLVTYTNQELITSFEPFGGEMNRTKKGFGINTADTTDDDTDGFDTNEWIDITFDIPVVLTNVAMSSWSAGVDQAILYVNGISNSVITETDSTPFDLLIPASQTLRFAAANTIFGNGWSLDSITVRTDTNAPPEPNTPPVLEPLGNRLLIKGDSVSFSVSASDADTDDIVLSATNLPSGASFNTATHAAAVTNTFNWSEATPIGEYSITFTANDGTVSVSETVIITLIEQPQVNLWIPASGPITLAWPTTAGSAFNVLTNADLTDPSGWGDANLTPVVDGKNYTVTHSIGNTPDLFYKLESK